MGADATVAIKKGWRRNDDCMTDDNATAVFCFLARKHSISHEIAKLLCNVVLEGTANRCRQHGPTGTQNAAGFYKH